MMILRCHGTSAMNQGREDNEGDNDIDLEDEVEDEEDKNGEAITSNLKKRFV